MDHALEPAPSKPKRRTKLTKPERYREQILDGLTQGHSQRAIASQLGISHSSISHWLDTLDHERQELSRFRASRVDALSSIQSKALKVQAKILDGLAEDVLLNELTPQQKGNLLHALVVTNGNAFDKERLETGQSTSNISVLSKMVDTAVTSAHQRRSAVIPDVVSETAQKSEPSASD